jgi:hypothetical protein
MTTVLVLIINEDTPSVPESPMPIDVPTRRALFASLREVYGRELSDSERLAKVSRLAGHEINSMSSRGNMTMTDAHRVLGILDTLRD